MNYEDVAKRKAMFRYVIKNDLMPPWNVDPVTGPYKNDLSLTVEEKGLLLNWIDEGSAKKWGKPKVLWKKKRLRNSDTDYIVRLPEKALIPAEGFNEYKRYIIETNFPEDKWIKTVNFFLKPKVIHHMFLFIMDESFDLSGGNIKNRNYLTESLQKFGIAGDGDIEKKYRQGHESIGYKLPKKSKLVLEVHYESIGQKMIDDSTYIRIAFHEKKPKYKIITDILTAKKVNIPPHKSNYKITASYKLKETRQLVKVSVHMHLRGKANAIFLTDPKGNRKKIFALDPFLQKYQPTYQFKNPITVNKGSILECINWFDNSIFNPVNPDPEKYVKWSRYLEGEMSECHFAYIVPIDSKSKSTLIVSKK